MSSAEVLPPPDNSTPASQTAPPGAERGAIDLIDPPEDRAEALPQLPWSRDPCRGGRESGATPQPTKRLSIDIPAELHTRIKVICARRGTKIADEVRALLEKEFRHPGR